MQKALTLLAPFCASLEGIRPVLILNHGVVDIRLTALDEHNMLNVYEFQVQVTEDMDDYVIHDKIHIVKFLVRRLMARLQFMRDLTAHGIQYTETFDSGLLDTMRYHLKRGEEEWEMVCSEPDDFCLARAKL